MSDRLCRASLVGDLDEVKELLQKGADPDGCKSCWFGRPITQARNAQIAQVLLDYGADIERKDLAGQTPLFYAAEYRSAEVVQVLLDWGAKVDVRAGRKGQTVLHRAAWNRGNHITELAAMSLEQGEDLNDNNPLNSAAVAKQLLEHGADLHATDRDGNTPLHSAVLCCNAAMTQFLLEKGSNVNVTNGKGDTPLHLASRCNSDQGGHAETVELLLQNGADVNAQNEDGRTPLYIAAPSDDDFDVETSHRKAEMTLLLVNHGADVNFVKNGMTPLHCSLYIDFNWNGDEISLALLNLFLDNGVDVNIVDNNGQTALHWAATFDNTTTAQLLLDRGAALDAVDKQGQTPLHMVFTKDTRDFPVMVQLLLDRGANVNATDENGATPLHKAVGSGHGNAAQVLLDRGAHVDSQNKKGETPLHLSVSENGSMDFIRLLLDRGGNPSAVDTKGQAPLHKAVHFEPGDAHVVCALLGGGAFIDAADGVGKTPLHCAAKSGMLHIVEVLVNKGASIGAVDNDGKTPLYYGALGNDTNAARNIVRLLLQSGPYFHVGGFGSCQKQTTKRSAETGGDHQAKKPKKH